MIEFEKGKIRGTNNSLVIELEYSEMPLAIDRHCSFCHTDLVPTFNPKQVCKVCHNDPSDEPKYKPREDNKECFCPTCNKKYYLTPKTLEKKRKYCSIIYVPTVDVVGDVAYKELKEANAN